MSFPLAGAGHLAPDRGEVPGMYTKGMTSSESGPVGPKLRFWPCWRTKI